MTVYPLSVGTNHSGFQNELPSKSKPSILLPPSTALGSMASSSRYQAPNKTMPLTNLPFKSQDEITYIRNEMNRLEELITRLHEERAALLRRLNVIQSPTTTLPAETLSFIFEHACSPPDFNDKHNFPYWADEDESMDPPGVKPFQLILGAVSSRWREVILSSPRVWDTFSLCVQPNTAKKNASLLRLFLLNSKTVPFTLSLSFPEIMGPNTPYLVHRSVDELVIANLPRMRKLYLIRPPRRWHLYTHLLTQLTECSLDLTRHETYNPDKTIILPLNAPVRRFSLQAALWRFDADFQLPWTSITSMTLSSIPPDLSVQAFVQCPNLVEFRCTAYSEFLPPVRAPNIPDPVTFKYLESFDWETKATAWSHALIRCLHVPVLRKMRWNAFDDPTDSNIQAFLNRLPSTLTELELFPPSHFGFIRDDMNIEHLSMVACTAGDLLAVFQKLKPRWEERRLVKPLPRLRRLTIAEDDILDNLDGSYSIAVLEMLDKRLDHSNRSFRLDIPSVHIDWLPEVRARLVELSQAGFNLQIHESFF